MEAVSAQAPPPVPDCEPPPAAGDAEIPTNDLGAALLAIIMKSLATQSDQALFRVEDAQRLAEEARARAEAAMRQAQEAEESAGFWGDLKEIFGGDIATIASVVAATASVAVSGGTSAPAILALAAAGLSATSTVGSRLGLDPKLCAALGGAGALLGLAAGRFGSPETLTKLATAARLTEAGATAAGGAAMVVEGQYRGKALHARADQKAAEHSERDARMSIDLAISVLEEAARDLARARRGASEIQATEDGARSAVIARIGAA